MVNIDEFRNKMNSDRMNYNFANIRDLRAERMQRLARIEASLRSIEEEKKAIAHEEDMVKMIDRHINHFDSDNQQMITFLKLKPQSLMAVKIGRS